MGLRRASWTALALLATIAMLAGCGGSSHKQTRTSGASSGSATKTTKTTSTTAVKGLAAADDYADAADTIDHLRVTIYDLRRSGPFVILDFGIVCVQPANSGSTCDTRFDFTPSEHYENGVSGGQASFNRPGGVYLIDPAASKEYRPVINATGRPDTSLLPDELSVGSTPLLAWAKFPAPASASLDVTFPNGGPQISAIPISAGAARTPSGMPAAQPAPGAYPADSTSTAGLTLPIVNLQATVGNPNGNDRESPGHSTITLRSDVLFHFNKSNLTPKAKTILAGVATRIKARATGTVTVTGYTDSIGTDQVNLPLSRARAASVVAALRPQVAGANVSFHATGLGSADPVAPNTNPDGSDNPAGRALNRRVTISFAAKTLAPPAPPPAPPAQQQSTAPATSRTATFTVPSQSNNGDSSTYQVTVGQLVRDGAAAVLHLTVTCQATNPPNAGGCDSGSDLGGTPTIPPMPPFQNINLGGNSVRTASGFYLIDPASGTQYIPFYDASGVPVASPVPGSLPVGTGGYPVGSTYPVWVYYPAPPASVTSVTVALLDHRMQIAGVPLS